jgi:hypothetical protein
MARENAVDFGLNMLCTESLNTLAEIQLKILP